MPKYFPVFRYLRIPDGPGSYIGQEGLVFPVTPAKCRHIVSYYATVAQFHLVMQQTACNLTAIATENFVK